MRPDLENLRLQELSDLLVNKTKQLIELPENSDGQATDDLQKEIENIKEVLRDYWEKKVRVS